MTDKEKTLADAILDKALKNITNDLQTFFLPQLVEAYGTLVSAANQRAFLSKEIENRDENISLEAVSRKIRGKRSKTGSENPLESEPTSQPAAVLNQKVFLAETDREISAPVSPLFEIQDKGIASHETTSPDTSADPEPDAACNAAPQETSEVSGAVELDSASPVIAEGEAEPAVVPEQTPEITLPNFRDIYFELQGKFNKTDPQKFNTLKDKLNATVKAHGSPDGKLPNLPPEKYAACLAEFKAIRKEALKPAAE